jgi:surface antigen
MFRLSTFIYFAVALCVAACESYPWSSAKTAELAALAPAAGKFAKPPAKSGQKAAVSAGLLLSAWAGYDLCAAMDDADKTRNQQAETRATKAPPGQQVTWKNPVNGNSGTIVPVRDAYDNTGSFCREFQQTVTLDGQQKQGACIACQQPDGSWKVLSQLDIKG